MKDIWIQVMNVNGKQKLIQYEEDAYCKDVLHQSRIGTKHIENMLPAELIMKKTIENWQINIVFFKYKPNIIFGTILKKNMQILNYDEIY